MDIKKRSDNQSISNGVRDNSFFSEKGILNIEQDAKQSYPVEEKRWLFIRFIGENPKTTIYKVAKATNTNYSQAHQIMRELVFCRLVVSEKIFGENGEVYDGYSLPVIKEEEKK